MGFFFDGFVPQRDGDLIAPALRKVQRISKIRFLLAGQRILDAADDQIAKTHALCGQRDVLHCDAGIHLAPVKGFIPA